MAEVIPLRQWLIENSLITDDLDSRVMEQVMAEIDWLVRAYSNEERHLERSPEFWDQFPQ